MKNLIKISLLSLGLYAGSLSACDIHGQSGFMPENKLRIPVGLKSMSGINEIQFNKVMDKISAIYTADIAKLGKKFVLERRWNDGMVNAYAHQKTPGAYTIVMFGGLARHPETTEDAMALVACHEVGHHLGGAPRKVDSAKMHTFMWASNEGQADYWGTMKCLRRYIENDDNEAMMKSVNVPADVKEKCEAVYKNQGEVASCEREALAGLALGRLLNSFAKDAKSVNFMTPDSAVVAQIFDDHPAAQCRLDTYFQASLCDRGYTESVSMTDPNTGVCSIRNGDTVGNRPLCWYKP